VAAADLAAPVGTYNLGAPPVTMARIVTELALALGRTSPPFRLPAGPVRAAARLLGAGGGRLASVAGSLSKWLADDAFDARRFEREFDWQPTVSLEAGVRSEVAWYRGDRASMPVAAVADWTQAT
jgi:nucleoside-diphosphate-sugar epimerase